MRKSKEVWRVFSVLPDGKIRWEEVDSECEAVIFEQVALATGAKRAWYRLCKE